MIRALLTPLLLSGVITGIAYLVVCPSQEMTSAESTPENVSAEAGSHPKPDETILDFQLPD